jgi:hypothetical protein
MVVYLDLKRINKKIQNFITKYIRLALNLSKNSSVHKTSWKASIETRNTNYIRRSKNLYAKIKAQDGILVRKQDEH